MAKVGNFEWILSYDQLAPVIASVRAALPDKEEASVCVIGCGTSTVAVDVKGQGFVSVVALDNDRGVIEHMQRQSRENDNAIEYLLCDLTEDLSSTADSLLRRPQFDMVFDKGTLDAILVEGTISNLLLNVHNILKQNGTYFLCSIHTEELLVPLLSRAPLCYDVEVIRLPNTSPGQGTVLLARKTHSTPINIKDMIITEEELMKQHYQVDHPLLTQELRDSISRYYASQQTASLPAAEVYSIMFAGQDFLHYNMELFQEDLNRFVTAKSGYLTLDEALRFISENQ